MSSDPGNYLPISAYGAIGNLRTAALVGRNGSIDWCCLPRFDSPSLFSALLDQQRGGRFRVAPVGAVSAEQQYLRNTNVLRTVFTAGASRITLTDWMPLRGSLDGAGNSESEPEIWRLVECRGGGCRVAVEWSPRFDYARGWTRIELASGGAVAACGGDTASLGAALREAQIVEDSSRGPTVRGWLDLQPEQRVALITRWGSTDTGVSAEAAAASLERTSQAWLGWVERGNAVCGDSWAGEWRDLVTRSSLALKLMIHDGSGGIVAAPTTSLPEDIGGVRNWDYRYSWIRDSAQTADALFALGHAADAIDYVRWAEKTARTGPSGELNLRLMYDLDGRHHLPESELGHLEGYRGSRPVRIGNLAADQLQLDIFGELLQAAYEVVREGHKPDGNVGEFLSHVAHSACAGWDQPDHGIWEARADKRHYVHSKVMVWVALDRAVALARRGILPDDSLDHWRSSAASVQRAVLEKGYDADVGAFVQAFGSTDLDATSLLIPVQEFLPPEDPRVQSTIDRTLEQLTENGLVYRYRADDGIEGEEGTFGLCTFWLVDALALSGRLDEAHEIFQGMVDHASDLGLYSEQIDATTGELLGNFPQAFTHIGLINSALYLAYAEGRELPVGSLIGTREHRQEIAREE